MTTVVCPWIGAALAVLLFLAPMRQMLSIFKTNLWSENVNPLPFPLIVANCSGWIGYGLLAKDGFVVGPNIIGQVLGMFYYLISVPHLKKRQRWLHLILLVGLALPNSMATVAYLAVDPYTTGRTIMGWTCVIILVFFYASPLSTMIQVFKTKDSSSIGIPLAITSFFNSLFWVIYGLFIGDAFIYGPNGVGVVTSLIQLALTCIFKRRDRTWMTFTPRQAELAVPSVVDESNVSEVSDNSESSVK